jgi:hypothetical protein
VEFSLYLDSLPGLRSEIQSQLVDCRADCSQIPTAFVGDATVEVLLRVTNFCQELHEIVAGYSVDKSFIRKNRETYMNFKKRIRWTTPEFKPTVSSGVADPDSFGPDFDSPTPIDDSASDDTIPQRASDRGTEPRDLEYAREVIKK